MRISKINTIVKQAIESHVFPKEIDVYTDTTHNIYYSRKLSHIISERVIQALQERNRLYVDIEPTSYDYKQNAYYPLIDLAIEYFGRSSLPGTNQV